MSHRVTLLCLGLLAAAPAWAQSSLGGGGTLPPPRPLAAPQAPAPIPPAAAPPPSPDAPARARPAPTAAAPSRPTAPAIAAPAAPSRSTPSASTGTAAPRPAAPPSTTAAQRPAGGPRAPTAPARPTVAKPRSPAAAAGVAAPAPKPPEPAPLPPPSVGSASGLPLPRFAALGSNLVNMRVGPDTRFPIEWTYQRRDLPVQIIDEHQDWRRIRDPDGTEGWVRKPFLTSRRSFYARGLEPVLRRRPEAEASVVARLQPGVIGRLRKCEPASPWCEAQVGDYRGWLRRDQLWGVAEGEAIE